MKTLIEERITWLESEKTDSLKLKISDASAKDVMRLGMEIAFLKKLLNEL